MVDGSYYYLQFRASLCDLSQEVIVCGLCGSRRVAVVKHVARHKQRIWLVLVDLTGLEGVNVGDACTVFTDEVVVVGILINHLCNVHDAVVTRAEVEDA